MDVWVMAGTYESDPFVSVHLTEKYALIAAIRDVMEFLGAEDLEDFEARCGFADDNSVYFPDCGLNELEAPQLRPVFAAWADLDGVWDNCQGYSITVMKTRMTA